MVRTTSVPPRATRYGRRLGCRALVWVPLLLVALPAGLRAQEEEVRVRATLEPARIPLGGTTALEVEVEVASGEAPEIRLPPIPDGLLNLGSSQSSQLEVRFPGGIVRRARHSLRLAAVEAGAFRLSPVVVTVDGKTYRSEALYLTVDSIGRGALGALPAPPSADEDILLQARLVRDTVFVGEPVTLTGEAWLSAEARRQLRRAPQYVPPSPPSFWIHDFEGPAASRTAVLGRRRYEVQTFRRAYVPITPGRFALEPARLDVELRQGLLDPFEPRTLATDSLRLSVLPLPEGGRPAGFTGAVGDYEVSARVSPVEATRGDAVTLEVVVEGTGYVKALPPPELPPLPGVEVFPPSEQARLWERGGELGGRKTFTWVLVPEREGVLRLPPVEYPFFHPDSGVYRVARSGPLEVRVRPGAAAAASDAGLRPLRTQPESDPLSWVESPWFAAAQVLPLLGLALAAAVRLRRARSDRVSRAELRRRRRQLVRTLHALEHEVGGASRVPGLLRGWLAWRLGQPTLASSAPAALGDAVRAAGGSAATAATLERLVRRTEATRFSPDAVTDVGGKEIARVAAEIVRTIDGDAARPLQPSVAAGTPPRETSRVGAGAVVAVLVLALAGLGAGAAAGGASQPDRAADFARGVERYEAGDFAGAAAAFARHVRAHPADPAGWYDLGNALHRAGAEGGAVWGWLQALGRAPRARDARANLLASGVPVALIAEARYPLPLSRREHLLAASLLWLLAAGTLAAALLGRGAGWGAAGIAAVLLAGWLGGQGAWVRPGSGVAVVLPASAVVRAEPARGGAILGELAAGAGVRLSDRRGGWRRVLGLEDAITEGWVAAEELAPLGGRSLPAAPTPLAGSASAP